jgi:RNA polymerase sigma-70 factor (ECF subfamily)
MKETSPTGQTEMEQIEGGLLQMIVARDRSALQELYCNYHPRLSRFLSRTTQRKEIIDEAINDTFWVVWNSAGSFRGDSRISTWIMGIAYRCTLKALRRSDYGVAVEDLSPLASDEGAQHQQDAQDLHDWIDEAMRRLSPEQSTAIELAYYHGYSSTEIAGIMRCNSATVKSRLLRARQKLRVLLPKLGEPAARPHLEGA